VQLAIAMNQFLFVKLDSSWVRLFTCNLLERNQNIFSTKKSTFVETGNLPGANEEGFIKNNYFRVCKYSTAETIKTEIYFCYVSSSDIFSLMN
jgi:hypothetical protein